MARIVAGVGTSHVPSIGGAYDRHAQGSRDWKPLFDAYVPVRKWLTDLRVDHVIVVYNDHVGDFAFDKYPTFAVGCSDAYDIVDEGKGIRPLPKIKGDFDFSRALCESLVSSEFDITMCARMSVDHGFLVPMHLCFNPEPDWPVTATPLEVNVLLHPLPTPSRCYKLGQALRRAVESYPRDLRVAVIGTGGLSHTLQGPDFGAMDPTFDGHFLDLIESDPSALARMSCDDLMKDGAGSEGIEVIMWLVMRGALSSSVRRIHRNYYGPMTTGMGLITFEENARS